MAPVVERARRVVVTGLGSISAAGCGSKALADQLLDSRPLLSEIERSEAHGRSTHSQAALVETPNFLPWLSPMAARRMCRPSKFAVVAAKLALEDAALEASDMDLGTTAVGLATSFGPTDYSERIVEGIYRDGPEATSPALFTESVANAPAAQVALSIKALGPNLTVTQREAGALIAVASVTREIAAGRSRVGLAGAVDEANSFLHAVLERFGALAGSGANGSECARPYDRRRDGFNLAEGAAVLVLESEERARERGVRPLARIRASIAGFDPDAPAWGWSARPDTLVRRLRAGLEKASIGLDEIDRIVAGASGSRSGDRLEGLVLRSLWGASPPPILAPKGVVGEYGGGHLAAAVLAAAGRPFGPTAGFSEPDPELGLTPHDGRELAPPRRLLVSSLAAGGAAAWAVLEAVDE